MLRLLTFLSAIFLASAAAATTLWVDAPRDGFLNLRTGPSTQYHVIGQMPHGSKVTLLRAPGKWVKVRHQSGKVGWAHSRFLSDHKVRQGHDRDRYGHGKHPSKGQDYWVNAPGYSGLNLRHGPGTQYPVIMTMQQRDRAHELGRQGKWILLRHQSGKVGWAHGDYLVTRAPGFGHHPYRKPGGHSHDGRQKHGFKDGHKDGFKRGHTGGDNGRHKGQRQPDVLAEKIKRCFETSPQRLDRCLERTLGLDFDRRTR